MLDVLLKKPRKIKQSNNNYTLYEFKPITCVATKDEDEDGESSCDRFFSFEKPRMLVEPSHELRLYFNYHHPNVDIGCSVRFSGECYNKFCTGGLYSTLHNSKTLPIFPQILHSVISEYSDSGYWHPEDEETDLKPCVLCKKMTPNYKLENGCCCPIVDKNGYYLEADYLYDPENCVWSYNKNSFVYKGKLKDE